MNFTGRLTGETVPGYWKNRRELFSSAEADFRGLEAIDSAGLAFLVKWAKAVAAGGGKLRLLNPTEQLSSIIGIYRVGDLFELGKESAS